MGAHHHHHDHAGPTAVMPSASLFRASALRRLVGVAVLLAILWALVFAVIG